MNILNALDICDGLITRSRALENRKEMSVIDFVLVCDKVLPYMKKFIVDEQKCFAFTNNSKKKISYSDHNSLIGFIELKIQKTKSERKIIFNYRNSESLEAFKKITNGSPLLSRIFLNDDPFPKQIQAWWKVIKNNIYRAFKKVRLTKMRPKSCKKFTQRNRAIREKNANDRENAENQLRMDQHNRDINLIRRNMSILKKSKNSQKNIWDLKKIFFPKNKPQLPAAKRNLSGQIITNPNELRSIYLEHFVFRMRKRPILPGMEQYQLNVENNFQCLLNETKTNTSSDWTLQDLDKVLKSLKINQSQDTMCLVNELFILKNIGTNLKTSLLLFFNKIKNQQYIPEFMKNVFITSIPKKRKSPLNSEEQRGIFPCSEAEGNIIETNL